MRLLPPIDRRGRAARGRRCARTLLQWRAEQYRRLEDLRIIAERFWPQEFGGEPGMARLARAIAHSRHRTHCDTQEALTKCMSSRRWLLACRSSPAIVDFASFLPRSADAAADTYRMDHGPSADVPRRTWPSGRLCRFGRALRRNARSRRARDDGQSGGGRPRLCAGSGETFGVER